MSGSDIVRNFYDEFFGLSKEQKSPTPFQELPHVAVGYDSLEDELEQTTAIRETFQARFEAAVERLDGEDKRIVVMRHFGKKTNREVAKTLNLSDSQASMRYLRAVRKLRRIIIQAEGDDA